MYNHARTLLINQNGSIGSPIIYPGDELIPADYKAVALPTFLHVVHNKLFGAMPDRVMLNYRTHQILTLLQCTDLHSYVLALDPRITYLTENNQLANQSIFKPTIQPVYTNPAAAIYVNGVDLSPDSTGLCAYSYNVNVSGNYIYIARTLQPTANSQELLNFTNGLSQEVSLPYSNFNVRVNELSDGCSWKITGNYRPTLSLHSIDESLRKLSDEALLQIFGAQKVEPYATFYNCWKDHLEFAYRFSGIVLAFIYHIEELRNGR